MKKLLLILLLFGLNCNAQLFITRFSPQPVSGGTPDSAYMAITDGNTVAWYISSATSTITKNVNNKVTQWRDTLGSGKNLDRADTSKSPTWSSTGILFDGVADWMQTATFTLSQPIFIYMVINQIKYTSGVSILTNANSTSPRIYLTGTSPNIRVEAGTSLNNANNIIGSYVVARFLLNSTSSSSQINALTKVSGNAGTIGMAGVTIGSNYFGSGCGNFEVKEIIIRTSTDATGNKENLIYNYLKSRYGL